MKILQGAQRERKRDAKKIKKNDKSSTSSKKSTANKPRNADQSKLLADMDPELEEERAMSVSTDVDMLDSLTGNPC